MSAKTTRRGSGSNMAGAGTTATDARVDAVEKNLNVLRSDLASIDVKVDRGFAEFGRELRSAVGTLSSQIGGQQKTNWPAILTAIGLVVTVLGLFGRQALDPVNSEVARLQARVIEQERRTYEEQRRTIDRLLDDARAARVK